MSFLQKLKNWNKPAGAQAISPAVVPPEFLAEFKREFSHINFERSRVLAFVLLLIHLPLLWRDIYVTKAAGLFEVDPAYEHLFFAHLACALFCSLYLLVAWMIAGKATQKSKAARDKTGADDLSSDTETSSLAAGGVAKRVMVYIFVIVILFWAIILAGAIANQFHGQITEYIIAMLGLVAAFYLPPRSALMIIAAGQTLFIGILVLTTDAPNAGGHITNTLALAVIAWVLSLVIFGGFKRSFLNRKTIEDQKARLEETNDSLEESNANLQQLIREKNELMGVVAHDLKNPLGSILLSTGNLQRYDARMNAEERKNQYAKVESVSQRMLNLVNDLLDENAIDSGASSFVPKTFELLPFMQSLVAEFEPQARAKDIGLNLTVADESLQINTDSQRLSQVLANLLSNAIKFSDSGAGKCVDVNVRLAGKELVFAVQDQGPGFSEEDLKNLYSRFARLSAKPTAGEDSSGLGLSIVKKIVDSYFGSIECTSTRGYGSCFTVRMALDHAQKFSQKSSQNSS